MSRFNYSDYDGEGSPPELWARAVRNALKGRRGQSVLRELKAALAELPYLRLAEGVVAREGEVCAIGALVRYRLTRGTPLPRGRETITSLEQLEDRLGDDLEDDEVTLEIGEAMGLKRALAWAISYENDEGSWSSETPEQRYRRIQRWVEENLVPA